ncbi:U-box domain-containing protein 5-like [Phragmites australis]|uniref:U-box domain-containing protein 5-like n=1 Tax=Phragmites australis TaxID=29695 RepID=UPI002D772111|nr:U-box domain-containing protein 5-like [Phragmites australis]
MENDNSEVTGLSRRKSCQAHSSMCSELTMMLDKISSILPSIEAARPGCKAGIQELCSLYNTVEKGKLITLHCIECSKLYLAITGEAIVARCERIRDSLRRSLFHIQNMVPPALANQIAEVHNDLRDVKFVLDPMEEEAGKAILQMLRQSDSTEELELETFLQAASKLGLSSPKAILIERRAIKKLLDKISGTDPKKEGVLQFFLYLIKKYGKSIRPDSGERNESLQCESQSLTPSITSSDASTCGKCYTATDFQRSEDHSRMSEEATPPTEFCCPISTKLMHDPVIITSGQTYEREYIERWFNEGYDTCPRTQVKLENFSMIPNTCMKDLICNWRKEHGFTVSDFIPPSENAYSYLPEQLHNYSMSSLHNVSVPLITGKAGNFVIDHSSSSVALSDASYVSDASHSHGRDMEEPKEISPFSWNADYQKYLSFHNFNQDMFLRFFHELSMLPVEQEGKSIKDFKSILDCENEVSCAMVSNGFVEAFLEFLKNEIGSYSVQAQKAGFQFFLAFLSSSRTKVPSMDEEAFYLITSFLDSELKSEALLMLHELVQHSKCPKSHLMASVVTPPLFKILASDDAEGLELSLKIICKLSSAANIKSYLISLGIISKLAPILTEGRFVECCLKILRNLCDMEETTVLITRTDRFLGSVAEYLDTGSPKERELAVVILLAICSRSIEDCLLVMKEGVIPALVDLSVNGTDEAKGCSIKLLHLLRDMRRSDQFSNSCSQEVVATDVVEDAPDSSVHKQPISKSSRFFQRKLNIFSKPRSLTLF